MNARRYDAVVVGSGFGGAAAALTFAEAGLRTVLLERGGWAHRDEEDWSPREILLRKRYRGRSPLEVCLYGQAEPTEEYPNEVVGGNSVFYGGASLRLSPNDFDRWPVAYTELAPYYSRAECRLRVHGADEVDGVTYAHAAIPLSEPARRIHDAAAALGYEPKRIPLAINFTDESRAVCLRCVTCDGFPCRIEAKNDVTATLLREAQKAGLEIVAEAIVDRVRLEGGHATGVTGIGRSSKQPFEVAADVVVLAAGALATPQILLRSGDVPAHGAVGGYLMRHCNRIVTCVFPFRTNPEQVFHKHICLSAFYEDLRAELGTAVGVIQDIYTPDVHVMRHYAPKWGRWLVSLTHSRMQNLLCVAEDDARPENRVALTDRRDGFGLPVARVFHDYTAADYRRLDYLTERATRVLKTAGGRVPYKYRLDSFSHAVGTVRFGNDPGDSALDASCRYRGTDNLFVTDGSFMPTSGGVNPSLTIAANAFRVADEIVRGRG